MPEPVTDDGVLLADGWRVARTTPDAHATPPTDAELDWLPASVPGTAAGALAAAGAWRPGEPLDTDAYDWWFTTSFAAEAVAPGERVWLHCDGLATVAEVFLNGEPIAQSSSMFAGLTVDVGDRLGPTNELAIRCRALDPLLGVRRKPRARWRTRVAKDGNLRWFRTTLLGRAPGFSPGPAPVGPWRPVRLVRRPTLAIGRIALRPQLDDGDGVLAVRVALAPGRTAAGVDTVDLVLDGPSGRHEAPLSLEPAPAADGVGTSPTTIDAHGTLTVPDVARWWPHTHGEPQLYHATLRVTGDAGAVELPAGTVGFRSFAPGASPHHDPLTDGLDPHVNGVRVFVRGAVWTGADPVGLAPSDADLRAALEQVRDAGMNLLRIAGTGVYESERFHQLCDELGIMVWQDLALYNFDYPIDDETFADALAAEVDELLARLGGRPSTVVVCGNSEIEQQVAMLGRDPALGRGRLFDELVPAWLRDAAVDAVYVPSSPCGGDPPFRTDVGIAHYFGVGGYRRPIEDARRADVRFAAECLALGNVPEAPALAALLPESPGALTVHHPRWKAGVPRDVGTGWDFDDVRDHYLQTLYDVDPGELRRSDHDRYLELSRSVSGEVMAAVFGEWRRTASRCGGGVVLCWRDVVPGAGWGLVDHTGRPKVALYHLRRALAPVAVWTTDEGLNGIAIHAANDRPTPWRGRLRVALYRDGEQVVAEGSEELELPPHTTIERRTEALVGRFVDSAWAYRFGPPPHDVVVATLERDADGGEETEVVSQRVTFPIGPPLTPQTTDALGLSGAFATDPDGAPMVVVTSRRFAHGVRVDVPGYVPADDAFPVEPGGRRIVPLRPENPDAPTPSGTLRALNLHGSAPIAAAPAVALADAQSTPAPAPAPPTSAPA